MLYIVCQNIRSAWNVGALMRTCDGVGASIIMLGYTPLPIGKTKKMINKTAIGAEDMTSWEHFINANELLDKYPINEKNLHCGIEISKTSKLLYDYLDDEKDEIKNAKNIFIWLGNEIHGLEESLEKKLDGFFHLPMKGKKESLNVSSCGAICLYMFDHAMRNNTKFLTK